MLLGVRSNTANDLCLIELGWPSLSGRVKATQQKFMRKLLESRAGRNDDPFMEVWNICSQARTKGALYLMGVMNSGDQINLDMETTKQSVRKRALRTRDIFLSNFQAGAFEILDLFLNKFRTF